MLLVVKKGREAEVERIFEKWDLHAVRIGHVTDDALMRVKNRGEVVAEIPNSALTDEAPLYSRPFAEPEYLREAQRIPLETLGAPPSAPEILKVLLASPNIADKRWVYRQYDHMVRTNTLVVPGMGAGVIRVKGTDRALALSVDCNSRYVYLDPYVGAQHAVAEAARNVACAGGLPIGATNCLNFGNPQRPDIMWQFARAVAGMGDACRQLDIPITGGNVSLYNETEGRGVLPTPVVGVVGLVEHADRVMRRPFRAAGDAVVLLGDSRGELGGSEYLHALHGLVRGTPPALDLGREAAVQQLLVALAGDGLSRSAHDLSEGGIAVALAECCFGSGLGVEASIPAAAEGVTAAGGSSADAWPAGFSDVAALFGESTSRVLVSVAQEHVDELVRRARASAVPAAVIGRVGGTRVRLSLDARVVIDEALADLEHIWEHAIEDRFERGRTLLAESIHV